MWSDPDIPCTFKEDRLDAIRAAAHLGIPFETWDFTEEYRREVVEYMIREYAVGRTPNPDVMCNRHIKFGIFLRTALSCGADYMATGHYVKKVQRVKLKYQKLRIANDTNKDQSYFLWTLGQEQLKHCFFPIGDYVKSHVRLMARKFGLPTAEKPDSQGICFIGEIDLRGFLKKYIPTTPGLVVSSRGKTLGVHEGLSFYTIGQRQGLAIGGGIPYYVADKDFARGALIVGEGPHDEKLFKNEVIAKEVNWLVGSSPKMPFQCEARIRYRQPLQFCVVRKFKMSRGLMVAFKEPQRAVTPGQSIVFYKNGEILGGGCIA